MAKVNNFEYAKIFSNQLDQQIIHEATSGWMEANAGQVKYNGGNEVKVPTISTQGLADYDRDHGFERGAVTMTWKTYEMTQDRGRSFMVDAMDVDETNFVATAGAIMGAFQREQVVPEIDSYRYSKLAKIAKDASQAKETFTPDASNIIGQLTEDIANVQDVIGEYADLVITMPTDIAGVLTGAEGITRFINVGDFAKGALNFKVKTFNGIPIIVVPSARMFNEYTFKNGKSGQAEGGIEKAGSAKKINWLITARTAPIAISKTEKVRIFAPDTNQVADAWKLDYRKYHDLWVLESKKKAIYVNTGA